MLQYNRSSHLNSIETSSSKMQSAVRLEGSSTQQEMPPPRSIEALSSASVPTSAQAENTRPILKIRTHSRQASISEKMPTPTSKIRIRLPSQPSTPAVAVPPHVVTKTSSGRSSKPTSKIIESKKRNLEDDSDDDQPIAASRRNGGYPNKIQRTGSATTIKVNPLGARKSLGSLTDYAPSPVSAIRVKSKREAIRRVPGDGYDSEASDQEKDPTRESVMVLRTVDGEPAEYLHQALKDGTIGKPKSEGGADFSVQFLDSQERRAIVRIDGIHYAAVLVDLPTITEAMKTWDRRAMMKNSDVSQMLLCFTRVENEEQARTVPLPALVQNTDLQWPHGLTPPMHDAVNRRFRKGPSERELAWVAAEVKKLMEDDAKALRSETRWVYEDGDSGDEEEDGDEDAEGEDDDEMMDYTSHEPVVLDADEELDEDELLAEFEAAPIIIPESATSTTQMEAPTDVTVEAATPAVEANEPSEEDDEEDEDDDDAEEDEDEAEETPELDEEQKAQRAQEKEFRDTLKELEEKLASNRARLSNQTNALIRGRIQNSINGILRDMSLVKASLGITEDE